MLAALTVLLVYQLVGEAFVQATGLPVPGPVVGMLLLFVTLIIRKSVPPEREDGLIAALRSTAQQLLSHLSLLFVPAGVGVMLHFERLGQEWLALAVALVVSTVITIAVTALVMRLLQRR
jgi:holin-like protein